MKLECICGEINARHCPVHNEGNNMSSEAKPREWEIATWPGSYPDSVDDTHDCGHWVFGPYTGKFARIHVIEKSAYDELQKKYENHLARLSPDHYSGRLAELIKERDELKVKLDTLNAHDRSFMRVSVENAELRAALAGLIEYCEARADQLSLGEEQWDFLVGKLIREAREILERHGG